jgi:hypothetical protein
MDCLSNLVQDRIMGNPEDKVIINERTPSGDPADE